MILQAEGQKAIDNLDDILSVEGVDIVFVGPYDLSASLGIIGQINHPKVMELIGEICRQGGSKGRAGGLLRRLCGVRQKAAGNGCPLCGIFLRYRDLYEHGEGRHRSPSTVKSESWEK